MDYFILTCGEYLKPPRVAESANLPDQQLLSKEQARRLDDISVIKTRPQGGERYADIITSPSYLLSDEMKVLFAKYDNSLVFKAARLVDEERKHSLYWFLGVDEIHCLSGQPVLYPLHMRPLVINQDKIGRTPIFKLGGVPGKFLIVRLDVAESLLRRSFYGIELKKVSVAKGEA